MALMKSSQPKQRCLNNLKSSYPLGTSLAPAYTQESLQFMQALCSLVPFTDMNNSTFFPKARCEFLSTDHSWMSKRHSQLSVHPELSGSLSPLPTASGPRYSVPTRLTLKLSRNISL